MTTNKNVAAVRRESQVESGTETLVIKEEDVSIKRYVDKIYGYTNPKTLESVLKTEIVEIETVPPEDSKESEIKRLITEKEEAVAKANQLDTAADVINKKKDVIVGEIR